MKLNNPSTSLATPVSIALGGTASASAAAALTALGAAPAASPTITGVATIAAGSVGAPSIAFSGDATTGIYKSAAGEIGFAAAGAQGLRVTSTYVDVPYMYCQGSIVARGGVYNDADTKLTIRGGSAGSTDFLGKITLYNNIATAGNGIAAIVKATRVTAQSAANASICTYTAPAADGSYEISMNMNVTAATALSTSMTCTYTDESNTARTMILPVTGLTGSFLAGGLVTATGAFETPVMHIRCKASTAITLFTATGTFTGVTYTAEGIIKQTQ